MAGRNEAPTFANEEDTVPEERIVWVWSEVDASRTCMLQARAGDDDVISELAATWSNGRVGVGR